ncbi:unnamed protein product [Ambrosiozyma monospora]|uniref:Unnamed protein product n=1 Tax=Ambrosiozyma monospora TaxID=43982 RepID=A0ACB5UCE2_AMBMO|nr:unnamed protein product [Ambrosiozyma monospora]
MGVVAVVVVVDAAAAEAKATEGPFELPCWTGSNLKLELLWMMLMLKMLYPLMIEVVPVVDSTAEMSSLASQATVVAPTGSDTMKDNTLGTDMELDTSAVVGTVMADYNTEVVAVADNIPGLQLGIPCEAVDGLVAVAVVDTPAAGIHYDYTVDMNSFHKIALG